jgi:hypothetical protein
MVEQFFVLFIIGFFMNKKVLLCTMLFVVSPISCSLWQPSSVTTRVPSGKGCADITVRHLRANDWMQDDQSVDFRFEQSMRLLFVDARQNTQLYQYAFNQKAVQQIASIFNTDSDLIFGVKPQGNNTTFTYCIPKEKVQKARALCAFFLQIQDDNLRKVLSLVSTEQNVHQSTYDSIAVGVLQKSNHWFMPNIIVADSELNDWVDNDMLLSHGAVSLPLVSFTKLVNAGAFKQCAVACKLAEDAELALQQRTVSIKHEDAQKVLASFSPLQRFCFYLHSMRWQLSLGSLALVAAYFKFWSK